MYTAKVVAQIREFLSGAQQPQPSEREMQWARELANITGDAADRLERCRRFLAKSRISEAFYEAEKSPPLLELCCQLDFTEIQDWKEYCEKHSLPLPQPIDPQIIGSLNNAYDKGVSREETLTDYRQAVRQKDFGKCVNLLRELRTREPDEVSWLEDLREFEPVFIKSLNTELENAHTENDVAHLEYIVDELAKQWEVPVPTDFSSLAERYLIEARTKIRVDELANLFTLLKHAQEINSPETSFSYIERIDELLALQIPVAENIQKELPSLLDWTKAAREEQRRGEKFATCLERISEILQTSELSEELFSLVNEAKSYGPLPDNLRERISIAEENYSVQEMRKRRLIQTGALVSALLISLGIYFYIKHQTHLKFVETTYQSWEASITEQDLDKGSKILAGLQGQHPKLLEQEGFAELHTRFLAFQQSESMRSRQFERAMGELEQIKEWELAEWAWRLDPQREQARANAKKDSEKARFKDFEDRFIIQQQQERSKIDELAEEKLETLETRLTAMTNLTLEVLADNLNGLLLECRAIEAEDWRRHVSKNISQDITSHREVVQARLSAVQKEMSFIESVVAGTSLEEYLLKLETYVTAFPNGFFTPLLSPILDDKIHHLEYAAYGSITKIPDIYFWTDEIKNRPRSTTLSKIQNTYWSSSLQRVMRQSDLSVERSHAVTNLLKERLTQDPALLDLKYFSCQGRPTINGIRRDYRRCEGAVIRYQQRKEQGSTLVAIVAEMLDPTAEGSQPEYKKVKIVNCTKVLVEDAPHCIYIKRLLEDMDQVRSENLPLYLLQQVGELEKEKGWSSRLKAQFMLLLLLQVEDLIGDLPTVELTIFKRNLRGLDFSTHWLCPKHPTTIQTTSSSEFFLAKAQKELLVSKALAEMLLERCALSKGVEHLGFVDWSDSKQVHWVKEAQDKIEALDIWALRPVEGGMKPHWVATLKKGHLELAPHQNGAELEPGEPLYTSGGTIGIFTALSELKTRFAWTRALNAKGPLVWPEIFYRDDTNQNGQRE